MFQSPNPSKRPRQNLLLRNCRKQPDLLKKAKTNWLKKNPSKRPRQNHRLPRNCQKQPNLLKTAKTNYGQSVHQTKMLMSLFRIDPWILALFLFCRHLKAEKPKNLSMKPHFSKYFLLQLLKPKMFYGHYHSSFALLIIH